MTKIPIADEFYNENLSPSQNMVKFAKLHVTAALEVANQKVNYSIEEFGSVMPNIVINSYPLTKIK